jgi:F0F1-type ATP synthase assembly protein I
MAPERNTLAGDFAKALREVGPYLGIGTMLAGTVGIAYALGYWLDGLFGTKPTMAFVAGILGVVVALIQFVRFASRPTPKPPS